MLSIRKVILYKHGVGFFERQGQVEGDEALTLSFKTTEMNDVLKSLTVLDLSGGCIRNMSYESTKPMVQQLEEIAFHIPQERALTGLLGQLNGAHIEVITASRQVSGVIAGVERVEERVETLVVPQYWLTLLADGALQKIDFRDIQQFVLQDDSIKKDLQHLLEIMIASKQKDNKSLTIFTQGEGKRSVLVSYVTEMPVWKTSYRILLDDSEQPSHIQGWALVDNTQDEDWDNVSLSLISGLPISFVHDLYSPRYQQRPEVKVKHEPAYAPPILESGSEAMLDVMMDLSEEDDEPVAACAAPAPMSSQQAVRARSAQVQTQTQEIGDLFAYEIRTPVTVKRNQSALVPIVYAPFEGKRVAIYNAAVRAQNPMSAVLFKNTTGLVLEGGPVTVMADEQYLGEAMLETLKPEEEKLVPFSVELGCRIRLDHHSDEQPVHLVTVAQGQVMLMHHQIKQTIYKIMNKTQRPLDLFLDHVFRAKWSLVDTPQPYEETDTVYRFRCQLEPMSEREFVVREIGEQYQAYAFNHVQPDLLNTWMTHQFLNQQTRAVFEHIIQLNGQITQAEHGIRTQNKVIDRVFKNQERIRQNLGALGGLGDEKGLRDRYVKALNEEEDQLQHLRDEVERFGVAQEKARQTLLSLTQSLHMKALRQGGTWVYE